MTNSYDEGFIQGLTYATKHFAAEPVRNFDGTPQEEKDFCLFSCPHTDNCSACDHCDGRGNLRTVGRPKIKIDISELLILRETLTMAEACTRLGISRRSAYYALSRI